MTTESYTAILFNKYYGELLKNAKNAAKVVRDEEEDADAPGPKLAFAMEILSGVKKGYKQFDHLSDTYVTQFSAATRDFYQKFQAQEASGELPTCEMFVGISNQAIAAVLPPMIYMHYTCLLGAISFMHAESYSEERAKAIMDTIRTAYTATTPDPAAAATAAAASEPLAAPLEFFIRSLRDMRIGEENTDDFKELEESSIGKLAKELVADLNLSDNMNPMDLLSGGGGENFAKLVSAVGGKLQQKFSSGEINQASLMQDAMQLATKLPQMLPGGMEEMFGGNMASLMQNFQSMMGGAAGGGAGGLGGLAALAQMMGGSGGGGGRSAPSARSAERLKKKLQNRRTGSKN